MTEKNQETQYGKIAYLKLSEILRKIAHIEAEIARIKEKMNG